MANLTFATIKIATKEDINNVFVFSLLKKFAAEKPFYFESIVLSKNREYVIVNYIPSLDFDIYDLIEEISKRYSCTFSTIGHSYGNMQQTTVEYIVAYKKGEVLFEGDYPLVVFDDDGEMDDDGGYPINEEATNTIDIIVKIIGVSSPSNIDNIVIIIAGIKDIVPKYYIWIVKSSFSFSYNLFSFFSFYYFCTLICKYKTYKYY